MRLFCCKPSHLTSQQFAVRGDLQLHLKIRDTELHVSHCFTLQMTWHRCPSKIDWTVLWIEFMVLGMTYVFGFFVPHFTRRMWLDGCVGMLALDFRCWRIRRWFFLWVTKPGQTVLKVLWIWWVLMIFWSWWVIAVPSFDSILSSKSIQLIQFFYFMAWDFTFRGDCFNSRKDAQIHNMFPGCAICHSLVPRRVCERISMMFARVFREPHSV